MIREKAPEADLKRTYEKVLWICMGLSTLGQALIFALFPTLEARTYAKPAKAVLIQLEKIPETRQEQKAAAPARPVVPIASDRPELAADVTIENTDLGDLMADLAPPPPLVEMEKASVQEVKLEEVEEEPVELWKVEKQPVVIKKVQPEYPDIARKANITGKVFVTALVNKQGKVEAIGKVTGPEVFHEAARAATLQWEFEPAIQNDKPVKVWVSVPFTFTLTD